MTGFYYYYFFLGGGDRVEQVPTLPPGSDDLDHCKVLTWPSVPQTPPHFSFLLDTNLIIYAVMQLFQICMLINEFEWPERRKRYEWTNVNYNWRIPLPIGSNWLAEVAIRSLSCWFWATKDEFEFWFFTAIAFRAKLIARNFKLIGESLKLKLIK